MRRVKSVTSERRSDRRRLQEKYSDRISTFRVCTNKNGLGTRYVSPPPDNTNQNANVTKPCQVVDSFLNMSFTETAMPLQQSNIYQFNEGQQQRQAEDNSFQGILAITPLSAFELLPTNNHSNNNFGFPIQMVPNSFSEGIMAGFQDQTINNSADTINDQLNMNFAANFSTFNQTVPSNTAHTHHHHHGIGRFSSDPSLLNTIGLLNDYGRHPDSSNNGGDNVFLNRQSPPQLSTIGATTSPPAQNSMSQTIQKSFSSMGTPFRPSPPSFKGGPEYFQATESFRSCFRKVDSDDNGFITLEELTMFLENHDNTSFNHDAVLTIMDMFDNNKDNMIDSSEFPDMLAFIKNWNNCFMFLDKDNSGTINYNEMIDAINHIGLKLSHKFTVNLLKKYDPSSTGTGLIKLDNFILACVTLCRYKELYQVMEQIFGTTGPKIDLEQFMSNLIGFKTDS